MSHFYSVTKIKKDLPTEDGGINTNELVKLIEGNEFENDLKSEFEKEIESNIFIPMPGAKTLINDILSKDGIFQKFDISVGLNKVRISSEDEYNNLNLSFNDIDTESAIKVIGKNSFSATTHHSSKSDFLDGFFRIKKFADYLKEKSNFSLLQYNLNELREKHKDDEKFVRSYRVLKDPDEQFYVRAITSSTRYYDYSIRFSVFVGIMSLYRASQLNNKTYSISYYSFDESTVRVTFEQSGITSISNLGTGKYSIELSNDEIKREALKLRGIASFVFGSDDKQFDIQPRNSKEYDSTILSISHGHLPRNWMGKIDEVSKAIREIQANLISDIKEIATIKRPDQIRFTLNQSFNRASSEQITGYKQEILRILSAKTDTLTDLLNRLNKIHVLANEDLEAREYIRYVFHDCIVKKKK